MVYNNGPEVAATLMRYSNTNLNRTLTWTLLEIIL